MKINFYNSMANALLKQSGNEYGDIKHIAIDNLKTSNVDTALLDDSCISSRLILGEMTIADLPREIEEKSSTGQNDANYSNEKVEKINAAIKALKKGTAENLAAMLENHPEFISNDVFRTGFINILKDNSKNNLIPTIFATILRSKLDDSIDLDTRKEFEYEMEPIIEALIVNKKVETKTYLYDAVKGSTPVIDEVVEILSNNGVPSETINALIHDLVTTYHMAQTITGKTSDWSVSLNSDSANSMWYVAEDGNNQTLLPSNVKFLKNIEHITDALVLGAKDPDQGDNGIFTAFKLLQSKISGKEINERGEIDTRFANPDKLLQHLSTMVFLCDGMCNEMGVETEQLTNLQFAIMNPLTDIIESLLTQKGSNHITEIVNKAYEDAKTILKEEQSIDYDRKYATEVTNTSARTTSAKETKVAATVVEVKAPAKKDAATKKKEAVIKCNKAYRKATKKLVVETLSLSDIYNRINDIDLGDNAKLVRAIKSIINYYLIKARGLERNIESGEKETLSKKLNVRKIAKELQEQLNWLNEEEFKSAINTAKQILTDIAGLDNQDLSKETVGTLAELSAKEILTNNISKLPKKAAATTTDAKIVDTETE